MSDRTDHLRDELLRLRNADGLVSAREAVRWARRHTSSHLYAALTWDDETAAEEHRVWQVRQLISLHVVTVGGERQFVSLSIDRREGGYRALSDIAASPDLREVLLQDALEELERVQRRYATVQELSKVWAAAATAREKRQATRRKKAA